MEELFSQQLQPIYLPTYRAVMGPQQLVKTDENWPLVYGQIKKSQDLL